MTDEFDKEIESLIGQMKCPKNFRCYRAGSRELCKARDFGVENYLECLEKNPQECKFAMAFGVFYVCKCPLRYYLAMNCKKDE